MVEARDVRHDVALRIAGAGLLLAGWLLIRWLVHAPELRAHRDASLLELAAAAAGFLCFSAGAVLATLGSHVRDEIEVSASWVGRRDARPSRDGAGITPACLATLDREITSHRAAAAHAADAVGSLGACAGDG